MSELKDVIGQSDLQPSPLKSLIGTISGQCSVTGCASRIMANLCSCLNY